MAIFWWNSYSKNNARQTKRRNTAVGMLAGYIIVPAVAAFFGSAPYIMEVIARKTRPVDTPIEADPQIMADVYYGRTPRHSSLASYRNTNLPLAVTASPYSLGYRTNPSSLSETQNYLGHKVDPI